MNPSTPHKKAGPLYGALWGVGEELPLPALNAVPGGSSVRTASYQGGGSSLAAFFAGTIHVSGDVMISLRVPGLSNAPDA